MRLNSYESRVLIPQLSVRDELSLAICQGSKLGHVRQRVKIGDPNLSPDESHQCANSYRVHELGNIEIFRASRYFRSRFARVAAINRNQKMNH